MKKISLYCIFLLLTGGLISGCVSFKEVGTFTASSTKSLQDARITYGNYQYCLDTCLLSKTNYRYLKELDCDCSRDSLRDTVILNEFAILSGYYAALTQLSGTSEIAFGPLGKSLAKGDYGIFKISEDQSNLFNGLSTALTKLVTTNYKDRKLKQFITAHNDTVKLCLETLEDQLTLLRSNINATETKFDRLVRGVLNNMDTTAQQTGQKVAIAYIVNQQRAKWQQEKLHCDKLLASVKTIGKGQTLLIKNVQDLKTQSFKQSILKLAGNIIYLGNKE
ncbi:MAG: hypothetical protein WC615_06590 [Mucilaginibacter sp.]|jgi:hypothetical protein|uniref:hypothetical protein n=1 Tax=Mucilaginibacter sp. TaxID=1882438 RepID=UPI003563750B